MFNCFFARQRFYDGLKALDIAIGLRVDETHEKQGLDMSHYRERGYMF